MIIDDLLDARILVELRSRLSFVAAARELNLPPATLSRRLARIEAQPGLRLFERSSRKVSITEAGLLAAGHAERMLAEAQAVELSLDAMRDTPVGRIRISAPVILGQALLGPILAEFLSTHPKCDLTVALDNRQVDLIEEYFDVVLRVGEPGQGDLIARTVGHVEAAFYRASTGRNPSTHGLDAVVDAPTGLLRSDDARPPEIDLVSTAGDTRTVTVKPRLVSLNPRILREAALATDLIVVLPCMCAIEDVEQGRLERIGAPWLVRRAPVHVLFTSKRLMRPAVRAFIDFVSDRLGAALKRVASH